MKRTTRILLVDDSESVRADLRILLSLFSGVEVIGEASNVEQAVALTRTLSPDMIILDLELGSEAGLSPVKPETRFDGCDIIRRVNTMQVPCKFFVLTVHGYPEAQQAALSAGADMFFVKGRDTQKLLSIIQDMVTKKQLIQK